MAVVEVRVALFYQCECGWCSTDDPENFPTPSKQHEDHVWNCPKAVPRASFQMAGHTTVAVCPPIGSEWWAVAHHQVTATPFRRGRWEWR